jgi:hypothetical protein
VSLLVVMSLAAASVILSLAGIVRWYLTRHLESVLTILDKGLVRALDGTGVNGSSVAASDGAAVVGANLRLDCLGVGGGHQRVE